MPNSKINNEYVKKKEKLDVKIAINNFGPISEGKIEIKPLTIFIGANNSGKSYAAMLLHSIFASGIDPHVIWSVVSEFVERIIEKLPTLKQQLDEVTDIIIVELAKEDLMELLQAFFKYIYEDYLASLISRAYACSLTELINIGKGKFNLYINYNSYNIKLSKYRKKELRIDNVDYTNLIKLMITDTDLPFIKQKLVEDRIVIEFDSAILKKFRIITKIHIEDIIIYIKDIITSGLYGLLKKIAIPSHYLPAARSGILQGHKMIAANIVRKIAYAGTEKMMDIPKFSGVVADFISSIIDLPQEKGYFYSLAQNFERELIKGEIILKPSSMSYYPEIKYNFQDTEIELHRTSSTVSELAPLFLYLKYIIEPGNILIIEEPEAHLHPKNQRILAKYLVRLIRKGVYVLITTHSDYLLEQLSNFIMLGKIKSQERIEKYKYDDQDYLKADEIGTYVFAYDKKAKGHKINKVEITEEEGISQEEFLKINEALYEETVRLHRDLMSED